VDGNGKRAVPIRSAYYRIAFLAIDEQQLPRYLRPLEGRVGDDARGNEDACGLVDAGRSG
jgi:hypothetical protein